MLRYAIRRARRSQPDDAADSWKALQAIVEVLIDDEERPNNQAKRITACATSTISPRLHDSAMFATRSRGQEMFVPLVHPPAIPALR